MREIIFRGLTVDTKQWLYGSLIRRDNVDYIGGYEVTYPTMSDPCGDTVWIEVPVVRKSVGQFTGAKDKNGVDIFEGDIMRGNFGTGTGTKSTKYKPFNFEIEFYSQQQLGKFIINMPSNYGHHRFHPYIKNCEVIGNMHESHELLKK